MGKGKDWSGAASGGKGSSGEDSGDKGKGGAAAARTATAKGGGEKGKDSGGKGSGEKGSGGKGKGRGSAFLAAVSAADDAGDEEVLELFLNFRRCPETDRATLDSDVLDKRAEGTQWLLKQKGTRGAIIWEAFKNYRRQILDTPEKHMFMHRFLHVEGCCAVVHRPKNEGPRIH